MLALHQNEKSIVDYNVLREEDENGASYVEPTAPAMYPDATNDCKQ